MLPTIDELEKQWSEPKPMVVYFSHGFDILREGEVIVSFRNRVY